MSLPKSCRLSVVFLPALLGLLTGSATAQPMPKAQVANLIAKVENGVDQFRDYLKRRSENAQNQAAAGASTPQGQARRARRGTATDSQKATAQAKKDDLSDALDGLNRSTNRLRRKFDATDAWMQTKAQVEQVLDDGRKINQTVARGNYGSDVARLWATLRTGINDLAR
ncbi:MAG TPA: hypothetical protein VKE94_24210, partial [Gemmataceae bacterium]|nr:hypothetical protein [Gemmataceae bacterium]